MSIELRDGWWSHTVNTKNKGEVVLSLAVGRTTTEMASNGKAMNVKVKPENAKHPLSGYIGLTSDLSKVVNESIERNIPLLLRFEQQRKKNIDNSIPMAELKPDMGTANENTVKILVGIYNFNTNQWVLSNEASAMPEDDSAEIDTFIKGRIGIEASSILDTPKITVIPQTYEAQKALMNIYFFIKKAEIKSGIELSNKERMTLSTRLIKVIDRTQMIMTQSQVADYSSKTHEDAREIIFNIIDLFAPLKKEYTENPTQWLTSILKFASDTSNHFATFLGSNHE